MPASIETQVDASGTGAAKALTNTFTRKKSEPPPSAVVYDRGAELARLHQRAHLADARQGQRHLIDVASMNGLTLRGSR